MKNFLREAADWTSEALETACGWALYMAIGYAILFVDVTGRGNLWSNVSSMWREGKTPPAVTQHEGVRVIKLGAPAEKRDDGVGLAQFDYSYVSDKREQDKAVVAVNERQASELTDAPADMSSQGKDWKRSIKGELRTFTVYGNGEQASVSGPSGQVSNKLAQKEAAAAYVAAAPESAYRAGVDNAVRPAISGRARGLSASGSDSVRNFKR